MKTATATLLGVCVATIGSIGLAFCTGGRLSPAVAAVSLVLGLAAAAAYACAAEPAPGPLRLRWPDWAAIVLFALFALRAFCWLVYRSENGVYVLSPNNLGDMPLHLTYIRYLAKGALFWPDNPIYSGVKLHYPLGIDLFDALWSVLGFDDLRVMIWVGLAACALACYALLRWGGWFAAIGFLCNGGVAGWAFFHHWNLELEDFQEPFAWKSIPLSMFVTQRGLLYAIPVGLLLMTAWRARWFRDADPDAPGAPAFTMPLWVQVVFYSTMPLFHLHTFLFLSGLLGWWLAWGKQGTQMRREVLDLLLWAVLPATLFTALVTGMFQPDHGATSVVHLKPGWLQGDDNFFHFWFLNFGFLPVAILVWLGLAAREFRTSLAARNGLAFVAPALLIFLVACFVMFAPWEWDNTKIMVWCYLAVLPWLAAMLRRLAALRAPGMPWMGGALAALCCVALFFSGFVTLAGGLDQSHTGVQIATRSDLEGVGFATRFIPPEATFVGYPTYNHPLLMCGCKMAEGYIGHLMSHGIDYKVRDAEVNELMMGSPDWKQIVQDLQIRYLYWGGQEKDAYTGSMEPWKGLCPVAAAGDWGTLYEVGPPPTVPLGR